MTTFPAMLGIVTSVVLQCVPCRTPGRSAVQNSPARAGKARLGQKRANPA
jgi:hypothetical protein